MNVRERPPVSSDADREQVQLGEQNGLRGLFAIEDIEEGEVLARVPNRYFLSSVAVKSRMERILEVVKEEVFDKQHLLPGSWINVDYQPWEIQVLSMLATIGLAQEGDTPEIVYVLSPVAIVTHACC